MRFHILVCSGQIIKFGWRTSQPRTFQPEASTLDLSTPDFSTMNFSTQTFQSWIFEPWGWKVHGWKSGVERSGVEAWGWKVWDWDVLQPTEMSIFFQVNLGYITLVVLFTPRKLCQSHWLTFFLLLFKKCVQRLFFAYIWWLQHDLHFFMILYMTG